MKISLAHLKCARRESKRDAAFPLSAFRFPLSPAFTLIEIALCLAIIGFALLAVMIVLPYGMNTQRDNREETVIGQDAGVLLEVLRHGSRGADDLTNYVFAITNYWTVYDSLGNLVQSNHNGFTFKEASLGGASRDYLRLTNGANIIGQMSQPELTDVFGGQEVQIPSLQFGGISNHVVAYVRSISGIAAEKPTQKNDLLVEGSFSYRIFCVNGITMLDTNFFQPQWAAITYTAGDRVFHNFNYWRAAVNTLATDIPGVNTGAANPWVKIPFYPFEAAARQRDLRLTFLWPLLPNGKTGNGRQTFRALPACDLKPDGNHFGLYFYQPQSFSPAP